jgi:hypothetical protein
MGEESRAAIIAHKLLKRFSDACIYGNQGGYPFMAKEMRQIIADAVATERERCLKIAVAAYEEEDKKCLDSSASKDVAFEIATAISEGE